MKILGIESATVTASCAITEDKKVMCEYSQSFKRTHSEKLMPLIVQLLEDNCINIDEIDYIAVSKGPGSYTGVRIGASIAKGLALAKDIKILPVSTMMSIAYNVYDKDKYIVPVQDAKSGRIYSGIYKWNNQKLEVVEEQFACNIDDLYEIVNNLDKKVIFNGDGSESYKQNLVENIKVDFEIAPTSFSDLKASTICMLGKQLVEEDNAIDCSKFAPEYLRLSQAERMCDGK